ncbi:MAG: PAS domain-containing protein [Burkholderiales bacterium]|nr:PAS domain-containing protein [Burkholderiales bacterium]
MGKNLYDFYPQEVAEDILKQNEQIMRSRQILVQEEIINNMATGKVVCAKVIKTPLYDDNGQIIGILGTSIDKTAEKEAELLRLENEKNKAKVLLLENEVFQVTIKEQQRFKKTLDQVSHEIRSPIASLLTFARGLINLSEDERIALCDAATRLNDIANNLSTKNGDSYTNYGGKHNLNSANNYTDTSNNHNINNNYKQNNINDSIVELKSVDVIFVDDNERMTNCFKKILFRDKRIDTYLGPNEFLAKIDQYSKHTKICLDNNFGNMATINGFEFAKQLHELGFTNLYMISGTAFKTDQIPAYLTVVMKTDMKKIEQIVEGN